MAFKIEIPPGVVKTTTEHGVAGRWNDAKNIRFVGAKPEKLGGNQKWIDDEQSVGIIRGMFGWLSVDFERYVTVGDYIKIQNAEAGATTALDNITPVRTSGTLGADPLTTAISDATVTVAHTSHGIGEDGAYVTLGGATAVGGITPDGEYLATYVDANSYTIEHSSTASSSATGGGASVTFSYDINPGKQDTTYGLGYGAGDYGDSTYGTARTGVTGVQLEARFWFISRWGQNIIVQPSGGTIYEWDEVSSDDRAVAISNAPSSVRASFVTAEGFIAALGTTTDMVIQWPHRDDNTDWTPTAVNTSNTRTLQKGSRLMNGAALSDINLIWSDTALYLMQFIPNDNDIVYDTRVIGENVGLIGQLAFAVAGQPSAAYWMAPNGFYMYIGGLVRPIPNQMDIREHVLENMDTAYGYKCWAGYNPKNDEVWFGYVENGNTEPNKIAIVNLQDFSWSFAEFDRNGLTYFPSPSQEVILAGTDRYIYQHEIGVNDDGSAMHAFVKTGMLEIDEGDWDMDINRYRHDVERQTGAMTLTIQTFETPNSTNPLESADHTVQPTDVEADIHMSGRYATVEFDTNAFNADLRLGVPLFQVRRAGRR